jgi:hypothetical protein
MTKERKKPTPPKASKPHVPTDTRTAGSRSAADHQRATQLLATAKARDLTADEMKVLSVVQLSAYATIQQGRRKGKKDAD